MTLEEWANLLDGREYGEELTKEESERAKKEEVAVAFGASDDLLEVYGAHNEEYDALDGVNIGFANAIWCPEDGDGVVYTSWLIESPFRHSHFHIYDNNELFCIGAVIDFGGSNERAT
jgi:hypothetical protein